MTDASFKMRRRLERRIALRIITGLLAAGYEVTLEEVYEVPTTDRRVLMDNLFLMDEDRIYVHRKGEATPFGWVYLVYGNSGWDVINDYTTNLEELMKPVIEAADKLEELFG